MRISRTSVERKRFRTALPNEPVPPVIISTLFLNKFSSCLSGGMHNPDKRSPIGSNVSGCLPEALCVQRSVDREFFIRNYFDRLPVNLGDQPQKLALTNGFRGNVIHARELGMLENDVPYNLSQHNSGQS